ncbi:hypothetical protein MRX96_011771 [Rhipicephalus microplus]
MSSPSTLSAEADPDNAPFSCMTLQHHSSQHRKMARTPGIFNSATLSDISCLPRHKRQHSAADIHGLDHCADMRHPFTPFGFIVQRGVALGVFRSALKRSCPLQVQGTFGAQVERLKRVGYPNELPSALATILLSELSKRGSRTRTTQERQKISVIPYVHGVSHALKKIVGKEGVRLVFSAPRKLDRRCEKVNDDNPKEHAHVKKHRTQ